MYTRKPKLRRYVRLRCLGPLSDVRNPLLSCAMERADARPVLQNLWRTSTKTQQCSRFGRISLCRLTGFADSHPCRGHNEVDHANFPMVASKQSLCLPCLFRQPLL